MFSAACAEKKPGQSDLVPFWCFGENQEIKIERIVPMYPMSKDGYHSHGIVRIVELWSLATKMHKEPLSLNVSDAVL